MARTWSVGVEWVYEHKTDIWADDVTFPEGMSILLEKALALPEATDDHQSQDTFIADIQDIANDPGIMDDPDLWEDETFYGPDDQEWFIVEN